jgi:hypothetical protein
MAQISFSDAEHAGKRKKTRREVFLEEMELVVPWKALLGLIEPHYPIAGRGRRPYPVESMLRVHLMQNWFALSDPAMEEALYEMASLRTFAHLSLGEPIPDETTILNFRHLLEANDLADDILKAVNAHLARKGLLLRRGSIVDATIIAAPSSTKNAEGERDPEMHQTKKGNQWHFGMKAHIAVDADSGLVHTVTATAANEADIEQMPICCMARNSTCGPTRATGVPKLAWLETICNGTSQQGPATLPSCPKVGRSSGSRSKSTARPACARRSSIRSGSSSASSAWRRSDSGAWRRTPRTWSRCSRCRICGWRERS